MMKQTGPVLLLTALIPIFGFSQVPPADELLRMTEQTINPRYIIPR